VTGTGIATEYPEIDYPGHQIALEHKQSVRAQFYQLAKEQAQPTPKRLADQLFLLMEGAYMAARMFGTKNPAAYIAEAARVLIDSLLGR
jgi:hypothetical protein